jgi:hypothetical protein
MVANFSRARSTEMFTAPQKRILHCDNKCLADHPNAQQSLTMID